MTSAVQQLIVIVETLFGDDTTVQASLAEAKAKIVEDEKELADLKAKVDAIPAPGATFDPTALEAADADLATRVTALEEALAGSPTDAAIAVRVKALEDRNASDDQAGTKLPGSGVSSSGEITVSPAKLPDGEVGVAYSENLSASGSAAFPFAFSVASGALPGGLSLAAGGAITGTPTVAETSTFGVQAHDANGAVGVTDYTVVVGEAVAPAPAPVVAAEPAPEPMPAAVA
jgi:hypothetical protein